MRYKGTYATEVLRDTFCALAISSNGQKLALATANSMSDGRVVLYDIFGLTVDTIPTSHTDIIDVGFGHREPQKIFYCSKSHGIYKIHNKY